MLPMSTTNPPLVVVVPLSTALTSRMLLVSRTSVLQHRKQLPLVATGQVQSPLPTAVVSIELGRPWSPMLLGPSSILRSVLVPISLPSRLLVKVKMLVVDLGLVRIALPVSDLDRMLTLTAIPFPLVPRLTKVLVTLCSTARLLLVFYTASPILF